MATRANLIKQVFALRRILLLLNSSLQLRSLFIFLLMLAQSLLELTFILTLTTMGLALNDGSALRSNIFYKGIFYIFPSVQVWTSNSLNLLLLAGIIVVFVNIIKNIVSYFTARGIALLSEDISMAIGTEIMQRFLYRDYAWHLSSASTTMFQRMLWRDSLGLMLTHLLTIYSCLFTLIVLFLSLVGQEPLLTILVMSITGSVGFLLYHTIRHKVDACANTTATSSQEETQTLLCATKGIREVLIYRQQPTFLNALVQAASKGRKARTFINIAVTLPTWVLEATGFAVVVLAMTFMIYAQEATPQRLTAALALLLLTAWRVLPYCNRIVSLQISVRSLRPMTDAVLDILETMRHFPNTATPLPDHNFTFSESIELRNVCFHYTEAENNSLQNINITIRKGEKIGIIGPSGAGKSTLAGILSGLLPINSGKILIDGRVLTPEEAAALVMQTGYVPQSPFLFAGTLAENIAFSTWGKPWDETRVQKACTQAAIDFVGNHPAGLYQPIGENGAGLSGGQAQRVSIARAMYTQPTLLIFDEATSALDQANENAIQQTIEKLSFNITSIIIAHRLTTITHCDTLIWLDKGRIVMQGKPKAVLTMYENSQNRR